MGLLEETLKGKSLADYTNEQLRISLNTALYTNTADMWKRYLEQEGYSGSVADMMAKWWAANNVPPQFRNYINSGLYLFNPRQLFADGSVGVLYDNSDLSTLFSDSAGTTAAVVNGPVGLQLDKSQGLMLGNELITNAADREFTSDTGYWTKGADWTISGGLASRTASAGNSSLTSQIAVKQNKTYEVRITATVTAGSLFFFGPTTPVSLTVGTYVNHRILLHMPTGAGGFIQATGTSTTVATIDSISIKELPGNHRYQSTTGSKPVLRGTPTGANLVVNPTFTTDTWWGKDPGIAITGGKAVFTTVTNFFTLYTPASTISTGNVYRVRFTIDSISAGGIRVDVGSAVSATYTSAGTYEVYLTATGAGTQMSLRAIGTTTATIDNVELFDVSAGSVTAPYGLQYDGVDDFMQTAPVNFSATDKMFVCAGVRKLSDAATAMLLEHSANADTTSGAFHITAPSSPGTDRYRLLTRGTIGSGATAAGFAAPNTHVVSGITEIATDTNIIRVNGVQAASSATDQGTGNYSNNIIYFGRRGGISSPFNGLDFGFCIVGKTLTASQIANTERWIAQRTGVTL